MKLSDLITTNKHLKMKSCDCARCLFGRCLLSIRRWTVGLGAGAKTLARVAGVRKFLDLFSHDIENILREEILDPLKQIANEGAVIKLPRLSNMEQGRNFKCAKSSWSALP